MPKVTKQAEAGQPVTTVWDELSVQLEQYVQARIVAHTEGAKLNQLLMQNIPSTTNEPGVDE